MFVIIQGSERSDSYPRLHVSGHPGKRVEKMVEVFPHNSALFVRTNELKGVVGEIQSQTRLSDANTMMSGDNTPGSRVSFLKLSFL